jgi:hypothetical protein
MQVRAGQDDSITYAMTAVAKAPASSTNDCHAAASSNAPCSSGACPRTPSDSTTWANPHMITTPSLHVCCAVCVRSCISTTCLSGTDLQPADDKCPK